MEDEDLINMADIEMWKYYLELKEDEIALINARHIFEGEIRRLQEVLEVMEFLEEENNE